MTDEGGWSGSWDRYTEPDSRSRLGGLGDKPAMTNEGGWGGFCHRHPELDSGSRLSGL